MSSVACVACARPHQLIVRALDTTELAHDVPLCVSCHRRAEQEDRAGLRGPVSRAIISYRSGGEQ